jgi:hypothetical protein
MYNYGAPSAAGPRPDIYFVAVEIARQVSQEAAKASQTAWDLEMAVRRVRLACTKEQLESSVRQLEKMLSPYLEQLAA